MKNLALFASILPFAVIAALAMEAMPATPGPASSEQIAPQQSQPQPRVFGEEALKQMNIRDLMDTDIIEIRGKKMTAYQFKFRIRRELMVADPANPVEVALALNMLYKEQRYELKPTYDESELARMMDDLIDVASRERVRKRHTKPSDLTGSSLVKPLPPPVAQPSQDVSEPIRPNRTKTPESRTQDGEEFIDLRPKLVSLQKEKTLQEGDNLIHTTPSGLRFTARVEGGRIIRWVITDKEGREVKVADSGCWSCRETDGETQCSRVTCPKK